MNSKIAIRSLSAAIAATGMLVASVGAQASLVINNGTLKLGVNDHGQLNYGGIGLTYMPTGGDSTVYGCECEGWGAAIVSSGITGGANNSVGGVAASLSLDSFTTTSSTAVSVVTISSPTGAPSLRVTHDYHPLASTDNLYEVKVSIKNLTDTEIAAGDLRYRRVMDWDIYPTPFSEEVTIQGVPALLGIANGTNVYRTDNNGFNSWNPLSFTSYGLTNVNFTDAGPRDHGALFDFEFLALAAGGTLDFFTYYGAAGTEAAADAVRSLVDGDSSDVDIELYSYGQPSSADGATLGVPNTFIFGFGSRGGILVPPDEDPTVPEPTTMALFGLGLASLGLRRRRKS